MCRLIEQRGSVSLAAIPVPPPLNGSKAAVEKREETERPTASPFHVRGIIRVGDLKGVRTDLRGQMFTETTTLTELLQQFVRLAWDCFVPAVALQNGRWNTRRVAEDVSKLRQPANISHHRGAWNPV
jgi:hypothetical protein